MRIWAIGDLHLSFGVPDKNMDVFGPNWSDHAEVIASHWKDLIHPDDLILIPGDISWAMKLEDALPDLLWIDSLPGTKVMIKGNHDYWWGSLKKLATVLPPSIHLIQNNAFHWKDVAIGGSRLWDTPEYSFAEFIEFQEPILKKTTTPANSREEIVQEDLNSRIFDRELERLNRSLKAMNPDAALKIAMTHYPPISASMEPSRTAQILEKNQIQICVFGHLHNVKANRALFGTKNGIRYELTSCDYLHFQPILIH